MSSSVAPMSVPPPPPPPPPSMPLAGSMAGPSSARSQLLADICNGTILKKAPTPNSSSCETQPEVCHM